jgi:hypothetical protein
VGLRSRCVAGSPRPWIQRSTLQSPVQPPPSLLSHSRTLLHSHTPTSCPQSSGRTPHFPSKSPTTCLLSPTRCSPSACSHHASPTCSAPSHHALHLKASHTPHSRPPHPPLQTPPHPSGQHQSNSIHTKHQARRIRLTPPRCVSCVSCVSSVFTTPHKQIPTPTNHASHATISQSPDCPTSSCSFNRLRQCSQVIPHIPFPLSPAVIPHPPHKTITSIPNPVPHWLCSRPLMRITFSHPHPSHRLPPTTTTCYPAATRRSLYASLSPHNSPLLSHLRTVLLHPPHSHTHSPSSNIPNHPNCPELRPRTSASPPGK